MIDGIDTLRSRDDLTPIRDEIGEYENVYATAIGNKIVDGETTGQVCIYAYVDVKIPQEGLDDGEILPESIDGVLVDVREVDRSEIVPAAGSPSAQRGNRVRPLVGGTQIQTPTGVTGTGGICVLNSSGDPAMLTAGHIVNDGGIVSEMFQPIEQTSEDDNSRIGVPGDSDLEYSDYALIDLDAGVDYTSATASLGTPDSISQPSVGERIVIDGQSDGLTGGELIAIDIQDETPTAPPRSREDFEYVVDQDVDTDGSSGSMVATVNSGQVELFAIHVAFSGSGTRFGSELAHIQDQSGFSFISGGSSPSGDGTSPYFEATIVGAQDNPKEVDVLIANTGGSTGSDTVSTADPLTGNTIDSTSTGSLDPFENQIVTLEFGPAVATDVMTSDVSWEVDLSTYASANTVDLSWTDNSTTESQFNIYWSVEVDPTFPDDYFLTDIAAENATSYSDTNPPYETVVWYAVTASSSDGQSTETVDSVNIAPGDAFSQVITESIKMGGE